MAKLFKIKDLQKSIFHMAFGKSCFEMTDRYTKCMPPFRYRNQLTGKVRDCDQECYENVDKWLAPLLNSIPETYIMTKKCQGGKKSCKRQKIGSLPKEESLHLTKQHHLGISKSEHLGVFLMWWYIEADQDVQEYGKEMGVYFPKSADDAALYSKQLLHTLPDNTRQVITIRLPRNMGIHGYDLIFPRNPTWQRFAHLIRNGDLQFEF